GAVRPEKSGHDPRLYGEAEPVDGPLVAVVLRQSLGCDHQGIKPVPSESFLRAAADSLCGYTFGCPSPDDPVDSRPGGGSRPSRRCRLSPAGVPQSNKSEEPCLLSPCATCWRPESTSVTRHAAGTPRCAASSSPSAAASTASTCSRTPSCWTRPTPSPATSRSGTARSCSSARRSRRRTPSPSTRGASASPT